MLSHALLLVWRYLEYPMYIIAYKAYVLLQVEFAISMSERKSWLLFAVFLGAGLARLIKNWRELDKQKIDIDKEREQLRSLKLDNDIKEKSLNA